MNRTSPLTGTYTGVGERLSGGVEQLDPGHRRRLVLGDGVLHIGRAAVLGPGQGGAGDDRRAVEPHGGHVGYHKTRRIRQQGGLDAGLAWHEDHS